MGRTKGAKNKPKEADFSEFSEVNQTTTNQANNENNNDSDLNDIDSTLNNIKENYLNEKETLENKNSKKQSSGGRAYKSKKVIEQEKVEITQAISSMGSFALDLIIKRLPNPIPLNEAEASQFNNLFSKVLYKHSEMLGSNQEEIALASLTVMLIFPRLRKEKEKSNETEN